jgi:hypothetical protein
MKCPQRTKTVGAVRPLERGEKRLGKELAEGRDGVGKEETSTEHEAPQDHECTPSARPKPDVCAHPPRPMTYRHAAQAKSGHTTLAQ